MGRLTELSFLSSLQYSVWNFCLGSLLFQNIVDSLCNGCGTKIISRASCSNIAIGGRSSTSVASSCDDTPEKCDEAGVGLWASAVGAQWGASLGRRLDTATKR